MTSDIDSQGAATVAELVSDTPFPVLATVGADSSTSSMWVSINGSPAGDWDGSIGRVSSGPGRAESALSGARRAHGENDKVDLGSAL